VSSGAFFFVLLSRLSIDNNNTLFAKKKKTTEEEEEDSIENLWQRKNRGDQNALFRFSPSPRSSSFVFVSLG